MTLYWVAQARSPDFQDLTDRGFVTFYPMVDDYVFLEAKDENRALTRKETDLNVSFLREEKKLITITEAELEPMRASTRDRIKVGTNILVVRGHCESLDGVVKKFLPEGQVEVLLDGLYHEYREVLYLTDIVRKDDE